MEQSQVDRCLIAFMNRKGFLDKVHFVAKATISLSLSTRLITWPGVMPGLFLSTTQLLPVWDFPEDSSSSDHDR
jgi:hypothetical protein